MINNRNIRLVLAVFGFFVIIALLATSQNSLGGSIQKVKAASDNHAVFPEDVDTLKGTTHQGTEPPYAITDNKGSNKDKTGSKITEADPEKAQDKDTNVNIELEETKFKDSASKGSSQDCNSVDYVVMVDAGSTGSRIHVYAFDTCVSPPALLSEEFEMLNPGLSSFDTDTKGAAASLDPLLKVALDKVPKEKQGCTPIAVKATAGLRLLGEEKSTAILNEVRKHLENDYPFAVVEGEGISIMDGKDEGVYAWVTTNYLLGNIGGSERLPTAAVFDLGGGSTQIVFEPTYKNNEKMSEGDHKYSFKFGDDEYTLYQHSHLGYGLMEGRNKVNALVLAEYLKSNDLANSKFSDKKKAKDSKATVSIMHPCIPPSLTAEDVVVEHEKSYYNVNFKGSQEDTGAHCRRLAEQVLNKEGECTTKPCSFNGVHQPSLTKTFRMSDIYVFSYFYDRTNPLGFPSSFTVEELTNLARVVCNGEELWKAVLLDENIQELQKEPQWCLDLSFISSMLHTGYDIPSYRELRTAKKIADNEIGWCLGASLPLLDKTNSGWKCRISEIQ